MKLNETLATAWYPRRFFTVEIHDHIFREFVLVLNNESGKITIVLDLSSVRQLRERVPSTLAAASSFSSSRLLLGILGGTSHV
ncbi:hypothetical protein F0562_034569 [Nyssa sinensis]|uniref:Uncharacterized protein n=1 Tax=Nyssa sinensis TaxID=561372 RepID=A0A5J5AG62_9ASTE|nr:hypothetical protein F0562_034569 [Nyssa sinensis]